MPSYKAPVEDVLFLLRDVFPIQRYNNLPGFADASPDLIEAVLSEAAKLCEETLQPLNQPGDRAGCVRGKDGAVTTPRAVSTTPIAPSSPAAGSAFPPIPILAARDCPIRSPR